MPLSATTAHGKPKFALMESSPSPLKKPEPFPAIVVMMPVSAATRRMR